MMRFLTPLLFVFILCTGLAACGFTPVHAPTGQNGTRFTDVTLDILEPADPEYKEGAFLLGQRLRDRIQDNGQGNYRFRVEPRVQIAQLGISGDDVATRFDITLSAGYSIIETRSGTVVDTGNVSAASTFGAPLDPYGRVSAEKNALQNIASEAADRLLLKLASFYARRDRAAKLGIETDVDTDYLEDDPTLETLPRSKPLGSP